MASFAIVAEGVTDQIVIARMIEQLCGNDVQVNFLQPLRDATDRHHAPHGGWELVFEYCQVRAAEALQTNDVLIVQVDTDQGDHPNYGLPLTRGGVERSQAELVEDATSIIAGYIGATQFAAEEERILPAVAVGSLESWLLLVLYDDTSTLNGFERLGRRYGKEYERGLEKTVAHYRPFLKGIRRKRLLELAPRPDSLGLFLRRLLAICPMPATA